MNRTYPLVGALAIIGTVAGLSATAAAGPTAATTPPPALCSAVPDGLTLIVNAAEGIGAVTSSTYESIVDAIGGPAVSAARGPDGTTWVERGGDQPAILRTNPEAPPSEVYAAAELELGTAGWLGGRSAAVFLDTTGVPEPTTEGIGAVVVDFADGAQLTVSPSVWWEAGVSGASIGANRVVEGGGELVDDWFRSFGADGTEHTDWISPNNGDEHPSHLAPVPAVAPDGTRAELSYLERGVQDADGLWSGRYVLVVADAVTGEESLRLDVGEDGGWPMQVDFDGRFWVGTFGPMATTEIPEPTAERVVVVDTEAATPVAVDAGCVAGTTASIDKAGSAQPNLPDPTTPPTTTPPTTTPPTTAPPTAPPTTTAGQCSDYSWADNSYPIQRCDLGGAVTVIQLMLVHRGFAVDVDGAFGPATEAAVREFQAAAGVEVDGLVGLNTWGALYDPAYLPGVDSNGNGTIEPWEVDPGTAASEGAGAGEADGWIGRTFPYPQFSTGEGSHAGSADIDGMPVWTVWSVGDGPAGSYFGLLVFPGGDTGTLLLAVGEGAQPATLTVVDAVDTSQRSVLAIGCSLNGAADPSVSAMVTLDTSTAPMSISTDAAWRFSAGNERIEPLDASGVDCTNGGLVVD